MASTWSMKGATACTNRSNVSCSFSGLASRPPTSKNSTPLKGTTGMVLAKLASACFLTSGSSRFSLVGAMVSDPSEFASEDRVACTDGRPTALAHAQQAEACGPVSARAFEGVVASDDAADPAKPDPISGRPSAAAQGSTVVDSTGLGARSAGLFMC
ncbi:hypothetical protein ON010_g8217 [Phytophthora cinnamomi]|nr:hypothetical protein ON010_g8217 [Phytophthora cinnamomi]